MPYHLHPEYPPEGIARAVMVARYGDHFATTVRLLAEEAGLPFNPHPDRIPNSRRALELSEWARALGGDAYGMLHDRIMDAYWAEGRDITGWDVLGACAADVGLDPDAGRTAVESGAHAQAVDTSTAWAQRHGIQAVPAFLLDGRLLVSGAHPVETFGLAIEKVRELREADTAGE
jgi:predicted DsbA family dithiol-disulfide isomerase